MAITDADRLRSLLGEEIPAGGSDVDTMFSDEKIYDLVAVAGGKLGQAALAGWQIKAAKYARLADVTEGNSSRAMSKLYANAMAMVKYYTGNDPNPADDFLGRGRVVVGTISRYAQRR